MLELEWLRSMAYGELLRLPVTLVWLVAFGVGLFTLTRSRIAGALLISSSLLYGLGILVRLGQSWLLWNEQWDGIAFTLLKAAAFATSLLMYALLIGAVWTGRKPPEA